jgi:RHS repeat-associated protein
MKSHHSTLFRSSATRLTSKVKPKPRLQLAQFLAAVILQVSVAEIRATPDRLVTPNRTLPKVTPAKSGPTFSANPTTQEITRARVFEEPLAPIGGEPTAAENASLAVALLGYAGRSGPDVFTSLTGFLEKHPSSPWQAAVLTCLGLEYYNTAHYSLALQVWEGAWSRAKQATDPKGKAIADRAVGELAYLYARLGRMTELQALLRSVEGRPLTGAATERIAGAREGLWNMQNRPEVSFKCGPYALMQILKLNPSGLVSSTNNELQEIVNFPSTQKGCSLPQVAELSKKVGLNYRMASRAQDAEFVVPSVVHWKAGHYAAMVRQEGDTFLLEDPTFGNTVWATRKALEAETSGYFLIPPGSLPRGWRAVDAEEGATVWGKGQTGGNDPKPHGPDDPKKPEPCGGNGNGMAVANVHLMLVSLNILDTPVGYVPPVGPAVKGTVTYNQRDAFQPANFTYSNFGPKWTCDWIAYITDTPQSRAANVNQYLRGGGTREFSGFSSNSQSFASQQYDQTHLLRTGPDSYELTSRDGSKLVFGQPDGTAGTTRKIFLTQTIDPFGNAVTLTYDGDSRVTTITDAIGQVTTLSYGDTNDVYKITRITDPFGRFASFSYDSLGRLTNITDVIGLNSAFVYDGGSDFIKALVTPYGTTSFTQGPAGNTRFLETLYPDGSRDRVEYTQFVSGTSNTQRESAVPSVMSTANAFLGFRNTFYWSRTACASSYGDYSKAKLYHWLHAEDPTKTSGILESTKEALEGRVWYDYAGQNNLTFVGANNRPIHVGRVLDDGTTQLYSYDYDAFGHVTRMVDPVGRTISYLYASNGIDLLEVRQTRAGNNELLSRSTYNAQHLPLTTVDAAGQTNTFTYNARGQLLTQTNPKGETTSYTYDTNGYLIAVDGPFPGTNDLVKASYDTQGRPLTKTDVNGYMLIFQHDNLDRLIKITHPDASFEQFTYDRLDVAAVRDRAGRQTVFEFDNVRQMKSKTDPMGRVTRFEWCRCGAIKSLTDPMGRTTSWLTDVQGRYTAKEYPDGSQVRYLYENATGRLRQVIDEKQQITQFTYNRDNTIKSTTYLNAVVPTPSVSYTYDSNYQRPVSMTDGTGTTAYSYNPVTVVPTLGANRLASVDGPLPNDTITFEYDALGRRVSTAINGVAMRMTYDAIGRVTSETNALGAFSYAYEGLTGRLRTHRFPNGLIVEQGYGSSLEDFELNRITHTIGATPVSEFRYGRDPRADRITTWSQRVSGTPSSIHTFGYDAVNQLLSATVTNSGSLVSTLDYSYDAAGNRLTAQVGGSNYTASYNALNQLSTSTAPGETRQNEWDAKDRLIAVNAGNQRTEFTYDGMDRMVSLRHFTNGTEASLRRFVWCDDSLCEERDGTSVVTKRFYQQGMKIESGLATGAFFYTRDHLGSIRELTDSIGNIRARYTYDPYGRRAQVAGDLQTDFGYAGMFFVSEVGLSLTRFRAYDAELARWLSRDPLRKAELNEGPNLYAYVRNNPVNLTDPLGLCCESEADRIRRVFRAECQSKVGFPWECVMQADQLKEAIQDFIECVSKGCEPPACRKRPPNCSIPRLFFEINAPLFGFGGIMIDQALDECVWIGGSQ